MRRARGWSQVRLAAEAGVPQTVVSSIERAVHRTPPLDTVDRLCGALDAELIVEVRPPRLVGLADQRDPAHSLCSGVVRRLLERTGWLVESEVEIITGRAHGFIDLLAYDPVRRRLLVIEIKTELRDVGALERQIGWYLREARGAAARLGWRPVVVEGIVVALATAAVDSVVLANRESLAAAFPVRGLGVRAALDRRADLGGRGLVMLDPLRRGWAGLLRSAADGRRTAAPYRDYGQFVAVHRRRATRARPSSSSGPAEGGAGHAQR